MTTTRRVLLAVLVPLLLYGAIVGYFVVREPALVYHPEEFGGRRMRPAPAALNVHPVSLASADGTRLSAWAMPVSDSLATWVVYYHGNAGNISYELLLDFYARWHALGVSVFAVDYRSYGDSDVRPLNERDVYADARAAYDWVRDSLGVPSERIVLYGHSLGSGIATQVATDVPAAALIVEGAFTSVPDRGAELYPWLPVRQVARNRFASIEKIGTVDMPTLIMHSVDDAVIPVSHSRALCEAAREPKECVEWPRGGHMNAFTENAEFWTRISAFLERALETDSGDSVIAKDSEDSARATDGGDAVSATAPAAAGASPSPR